MANNKEKQNINTAEPHKTTSYHRLDIQGLRAIAVIAVVLFHLDFNLFAGGYIGVDLFFVISGFLISKQILHHQIYTTDTIRLFLIRRALRILPAFWLVTAVTTILACFLLRPKELVNFASSLSASSLYLTNMHFAYESSYFSDGQLFRPLLHLWSLAIELQFYLLAPLIFLVYRWLNFRRSPLVVLILFSFITSCYWLYHQEPEKAFYILTSRLWEFLIGMLIACFVNSAPLKKPPPFMVDFGVFLIAISILVYSPTTPFPGPTALFPVVGAALVIWGGHNVANKSVTMRFLCSPMMTSIGKYSYSIYLWHWPFIIFTQYYLERPLTLIESLLIIVATLVVSVFSFYYVEERFRNTKIQHYLRFLLLCLLVSLTFLAMGNFIFTSKGLPQRFDADIQKIFMATDQIQEKNNVCLRRGKRLSKDELAICSFGNSQQQVPTLAIWGDSHADALIPVLNRIFETSDQQGIQLTSTGCPPLINVDIDVSSDIFRSRSKAKFKRCKHFNSWVMTYLEQNPQITKVILHARWGYYTNTTPTENDGKNIHIYLLDKDNSSRSVDNSQQVFSTALTKTISTLNDLGMEVIIIASIPEWSFDVPECLLKQYRGEIRRCDKVKYMDFQKRQHFVFEQFREQLARQQQVLLYSPHKQFCDDVNCRMLDESGFSLYRDDDHLSEKGAFFLRSQLAEILATK